MRNTLLLAPMLLLLSSCGSTPAAAPAPDAPPGCCGACAMADPAPAPASGETALDVFLRDHPYTDTVHWFSLEVARSTVTETRRRIYVEKEAVTRALLAHAGGSGFEAAPLRYAPGTVFIAEALDEEGNRLDTEVLRVRPPGPPFLLFDREGHRSSHFVRPADPEGSFAPRVCMMCHAGEETFEPMRSFPRDTGPRAVVTEERFRDPAPVERFLEARHRGDMLFGPYGGIWLARLAADARDGTLSPVDRTHWERLRARYPDLLPPPER